MGLSKYFVYFRSVFLKLFYSIALSHSQHVVFAPQA